MLETKQGQFRNQHEIPHKVMKRYFQVSSYFSDEARKTKQKVVK